ncbi:hypothetical protein MVEN_00957600 [Mycena venus]|uniref:F-box domain-containing protein n=1 Tax=Mycena venus TaxID=2733690 RepID=A0A8H7D239_9AGAR|nr:hypothetical protein MVEN_00957600 [Mycena venus]
MSLKEFPTELLTRIFLHLSYKSLLRVEAVCVQWKSIVAKDPELSVQMFKKISQVYVEPGSNEPSFRFESGCYAAKSEPVRLHPALNQASYYMGNDLESVNFYLGNDNPNWTQLCKLAIASDFISIPVVTMATLVLPDRIFGFKIKVKNAKGVRLTDVFVAMHKESNVPVMTRDYGMMTRAEALGDHRYYEGLQNVARQGLGLSAEMFLGS